MEQKYFETIKFLHEKINDFLPEVLIVLGSGLSEFCANLEGIRVKYCEIPHFGYSKVEGHKGELLFCNICGKNCAIMQGRFHFYEGNPLNTIIYPIIIFKKLGIKTVILTNAAGAINKSFSIGDIMMITDHINFMGQNPLIGKNDDTLGTRFPDMSEIYSISLQKLAKNCAQKLKINLKEGVYLATTGPSYETKAEIKAFSVLGADAVGMSTVPEAIVANYLKLDILAFSMITNFAAGISKQKLEHEEVLKTGKEAGSKISSLIKEIIKNL